MLSVTCFLMMLNFSFIGLLPIIFFKREGRLNLKWWLTAWPYFTGGVAMFLAAFGWLEAFYSLPPEILYVSTTLSAISLGFMGYAMGSNRVSLSLWHQENDKPQAIVTVGAYRLVRHPFYTSFIICLTAALIGFPHPITLICFLGGIIALQWTARGEESRLSQSQFGKEYQDYMKQTGRFFPRLMK